MLFKMSYDMCLSEYKTSHRRFTKSDDDEEFYSLSSGNEEPILPPESCISMTKVQGRYKSFYNTRILYPFYFIVFN